MAFFLTLLLGLTPAQAIVGIDSLTGDYIEIDPVSGQGHIAGHTGLSGVLWHSLAVTSYGQLYAAAGGLGQTYDLYTIDTRTGASTFVVATPLLSLLGLAFGPNGELYAIGNRVPQQASSPDDLFRIDLATGNATLVGGLGTISMTSIASWGGILWGYDKEVGLVRIDPQTAQVTDVRPGFGGPYDLGESICFRPDGMGYQVDYWLWTFDPADGVPARIGETGWRGVLGCAEYLEDPNGPEPFALTIQGERGDVMRASVAGATPWSPVVVVWGRRPYRSWPIPSAWGCAGTVMDVRFPPRLAWTGLADGTGRVRTDARLTPWFRKERFRAQAVDLATCAASNVAEVVF